MVQIPEWGMPCMVPLISCCKKRPPSNIFSSAVPEDSTAGFCGSVHYLVRVVQLPARLANNLCCSPGVASLVYTAIISSGLSGLCVCALSACALHIRHIDTVRTKAECKIFILISLIDCRFISDRLLSSSRHYGIESPVLQPFRIGGLRIGLHHAGYLWIRKNCLVDLITMGSRFEYNPGKDYRLVSTGLCQLPERHHAGVIQIITDTLDILQYTMALSTQNKPAPPFFLYSLSLFLAIRITEPPTYFSSFSPAIWISLRSRLAPNQCSLANLLRTHIAHMRGNRPLVTKRIFDTTIAIPPEHIRNRHGNLGTDSNRLFDYFIHILHLQM